MQRNILRVANVQLVQTRFYTEQQVRVRFAPSPTGYLHLGGLRTALYNYLFARANNGSFVLRIEDTDRSRLVPGATEKLQDDLFWAGIIPDEDPIRGGPTGPYVQSRRIELYNEQVNILLNNGSAYHCFCSDGRLDLIRRDALRNRQIPKYDNKCRHRSREDVNQKIRKGDPYCVRFKLTPNTEPFDDLVYGPISYDVAQNEGDPVIIKTDGFPTYHFANVVDDHFMEISHVLRGVEWQISTPKHILLYKAFGWTPPQFAHLPLILNADGTKLSKRQGDIRIDSFREQGIFPSALLNYITHAGGGFTKEQSIKQRCFSYEEMIKQFDLSRVNVNSCRLMPEKLLEYNKLEISQLLEDDNNTKFLVERVVKIVSEAFPERRKDSSLQLDEQHVIAVLRWAQHRISNLTDLTTSDLAFLWVVPSSPPLTEKPEHLEAVKVLSEKLASKDLDNFEKETLKNCLKEFASNNGIPFTKLMKILRSILSGLKEGPGVAEMMEILGRDATLSRLKKALS